MLICLVDLSASLLVGLLVYWLICPLLFDLSIGQLDGRSVCLSVSWSVCHSFD